MNSNKLRNCFLVIIPILILGIPFHYTSFIICLFFLIIRLITTDKHTAGIFLLIYGGSFGGATRLMYPFIPVYGLLLELIGALMLWKVICNVFNHNNKSLIYLLIVFIYWGICYFYGPQTSFALTKYTSIITNGLTLLCGFYAIYKSSRFSSFDLSQILLLATITIISFSVDYYHMNPGELFDFNWSRRRFFKRRN